MLVTKKKKKKIKQLRGGNIQLSKHPKTENIIYSLQLVDYENPQKCSFRNKRFRGRHWDAAG